MFRFCEFLPAVQSMGDGIGMAQVMWVALGVAALLWVRSTVEWVWLKPRRLERVLRQQGLRGNPYRLLHGDNKQSVRLIREALARPMPPFSHDIAARVLPLAHNALEEHGKISFTWAGPTPRVILMDPALIREVISNKFGHFIKPKLNPVAKISVQGLANYEGEKWAKHRRIINPAFHLEKLKRMLPAFSTCCAELVNRWETRMNVESYLELDVWPELQNLTGDVICRTAFGSSYKEGRRIFELQVEQFELMLQAIQSVYIPGYRFLPTQKNIRRNEIDKEMRRILRGMIEKREKDIWMGGSSNDDLLGLLMEANMMEAKGQVTLKNKGLSIDDVIEECKLFFFAGQETTSVMLTWTIILLGMYPSWQARAREEVLQAFGESELNMEGLSRLKIMPMILYEALRLYPPVFFFNRSTYKTMRIGGVSYPPGVMFMLPLVFVHHSPEFWGKDANEFKPERFAEGVSKASKVPGAFFPFGGGPRICIGQNFALIEAKIALAMILQRFSFELSSSYVHAPTTVITLKPQHGALIKLRKL